MYEVLMWLAGVWFGVCLGQSGLWCRILGHRYKFDQMDMDEPTHTFCCRCGIHKQRRP